MKVLVHSSMKLHINILERTNIYIRADKAAPLFPFIERKILTSMEAVESTPYFNSQMLDTLNSLKHAVSMSQIISLQKS